MTSNTKSIDCKLCVNKFGNLCNASLDENGIRLKLSEKMKLLDCGYYKLISSDLCQICVNNINNVCIHQFESNGIIYQKEITVRNDCEAFEKKV